MSAKERKKRRARMPASSPGRGKVMRMENHVAICGGCGRMQQIPWAPGQSRRDRYALLEAKWKWEKTRRGWCCPGCKSSVHLKPKALG